MLRTQKPPPVLSFTSWQIYKWIHFFKIRFESLAVSKHDRKNCQRGIFVEWICPSVCLPTIGAFNACPGFEIVPWLLLHFHAFRLRSYLYVTTGGNALHPSLQYEWRHVPWLANVEALLTMDNIEACYLFTDAISGLRKSLCRGRP